MKKLSNKKQLLIYALSALGVNMLNLIIGTYLVEALMVEGFGEGVEYWTYFNVTIVSAALWSIFVTAAKIINGIIDIPLAGIADNFKSRWGRRRPFILFGLIGTITFYVLFLFPLVKDEGSFINTIWFGIILALFYIFYNLTIVTYYATFAEITKDEGDKIILSNYKSIFDVIYFVLGYALIPLFVTFKINIRIIAFIFLPLSLTMIIPLFMIKERSTKKNNEVEETKKEPEKEKFRQIGVFKSIIITFKNKGFLKWVVLFMLLQFGLQMFMAGENVYFSGVLNFEGYKITLITATVFMPVPFTLMIYRKICARLGFKFGFIYSAIMFISAMVLMTLCILFDDNLLRFIMALVAGFIASFGVGAFLSVGYAIPSIYAQMDYKKTGISHSAMYFAVQTLAASITGAISSGIVWINLRNNDLSWILGIVVASATFLAMIIALFLPKEINNFGKIRKDSYE